MFKLSDSAPWATLLVGGLVLIAAGVGGAVVIWGKDGALTFSEYLDLLKNFAIAVGILGIGRGIVSYGKKTAEGASLSDRSLLAIGPPSDEWRTTAAGDGQGAMGEPLSAEAFEEPGSTGY